MAALGDDDSYGAVGYVVFVNCATSGLAEVYSSCAFVYVVFYD